MADCGPKAKRLKHSVISEHIYSPEFEELFSKHWHGDTDIQTENLNVIAKPYRVCRISNFLRSEEFMEEIKNELFDVKSRRNCMDLYQFEQTGDLANVDRTNVKLLHEAFRTDLASWMEQNTKIPLNGTMSMSSACYSDTDYLLCHDDNMGDRRIAFILYLSKNWVADDGGALDLFNTDENGLPKDIVKSLVPEYNSLVFFEVVDNSYHQVAEVTSAEKSRWSIIGWFHGPLRESTKPPRPEFSKDFVLPVDNVIDLSYWIEICYLTTNIISQIQRDVEEDSYTMLANFVDSHMYQILLAEMTLDSISWKKVGPADERNYEVADEETLPTALKDFYNMFKSRCTFRLLKDYTELDLIKISDDMNPRMTIELQRWSKGCYTLMSDRSTNIEGPSVTDAEKSATVQGTKPNVDQPETQKKPNEENGNQSAPPIKETPSKEKGLNGTDENGSRNGSHVNINRNGQNCAQPERDGSTSAKDEEDKDKRSFKKPLADSSSQEASISKTHNSTPEKVLRSLDSDDSDVSDIGDYLSDHVDCSPESSEQIEEEIEEDPAIPQPGALDVIIQFHTSGRSTNNDEFSIDYVDSSQTEGALIHIPPRDNHLYLVYRTAGICRVHKYVNHYCKGYFYNLVCTYYE